MHCNLHYDFVLQWQVCLKKIWLLLGCSISIICVTEVIFFNFLQHLTDFPVICHLLISASLKLSTSKWAVIQEAFSLMVAIYEYLTHVCVNHASRADSSFSSFVSVICVRERGLPVICNFFQLVHSFLE